LRQTAKRNGETFENLLLPGFEGLSLLGELIAKAFDLELEIRVSCKARRSAW